MARHLAASSLNGNAFPRRTDSSLAVVPVPISQCTIEFRRRGDLLTYLYYPCKSANSFPSWKRKDADIWLVRHEALGWVGVGAEGEVLCIPWAVPPGTQGRAPPPGVWVSRKEEKSYVYDLVYA
jgi:hypothetical protein